jgi:hypothetical protein
MNTPADGVSIWQSDQFRAPDRSWFVKLRKCFKIPQKIPRSLPFCYQTMLKMSDPCVRV